MYNYSGKNLPAEIASMQFIPTMHFWINVHVNNTGQCLAETTQDA